MNFSTAMADSNYCPASGGPGQAGSHTTCMLITDYTTSNVRLITVQLSNDSVRDDTHVSATIFGN